MEFSGVGLATNRATPSSFHLKAITKIRKLLAPSSPSPHSCPLTTKYYQFWKLCDGRIRHLDLGKTSDNTFFYSRTAVPSKWTGNGQLNLCFQQIIRLFFVLFNINLIRITYLLYVPTFCSMYILLSPPVLWGLFPSIGGLLFFYNAHYCALVATPSVCGAGGTILLVLIIAVTHRSATNSTNICAWIFCH